MRLRQYCRKIKKQQYLFDKESVGRFVATMFTNCSMKIQSFSFHYGITSYIIIQQQRNNSEMYSRITRTHNNR